MTTPLADPLVELIDRWQREFPLCARPYAEIGATCGLTEHEVIESFESAVERGLMTRIGAAVKPNTVGVSTLAAMAVPGERLAKVAGIVSAEPGVSHNYEREHEINLWFVVAAATPELLLATLRRIAEKARLSVINLPLRRSYHIDLGFPLGGTGKVARSARVDRPEFEPTAADRLLLAAIEDGLPLVPRPYAAVAELLDWPEDQVLTHLGVMIDAGVVVRFGAILRHRALGFRANAMAVWDVPDERVDGIATLAAAHPRVTLCYRRERCRPAWPYNLYCMVHGRSRVEAGAILDEIAAAAGLAPYHHAVLFSRRCFKQRGARFGSVPQEAA